MEKSSKNQVEDAQIIDENKTVNLHTLTVEWIDGSKKEVEFNKSLAELIFKQTAKINEHIFATELYKNPIVVLNEENKEIIRNYTEKGFLAYVQVAVHKLLEQE